MKIVLLSCVASKGKEKSKAKDLYKGSLFSKSFSYAKKLNPDKIFILSALHSLLELDAEIDPYNVTLSNIPKSKRKSDLKVLNKEEKIKWGEEVIEQLQRKANLNEDTFIILAGESYIKPIRTNIKIILEPMKGLKQGERLKFLTEQLK